MVDFKGIETLPRRPIWTNSSGQMAVSCRLIKRASELQSPFRGAGKSDERLCSREVCLTSNGPSHPAEDCKLIPARLARTCRLDSCQLSIRCRDQVTRCSALCQRLVPQGGNTDCSHRLIQGDSVRNAERKAATEPAVQIHCVSARESTSVLTGDIVGKTSFIGRSLSSITMADLVDVA